MGCRWCRRSHEWNPLGHCITLICDANGMDVTPSGMLSILADNGLRLPVGRTQCERQLGVDRRLLSGIK